MATDRGLCDKCNQMCHLQYLLCFPRLWSGVSDESDFPNLEVIVRNTPDKKVL